MYWNQWHLCLEGYKRIWIQNTYCATLKVHLGICQIWSLLCLCTHLPSPSIATNLFLHRYTWLFSLLMCIYRPQYTDRVWCESPSSCTSFLGISHLNVTRINSCISFNTAWPLVVWGHQYWGRWRHTLSLARWDSRYDEVTPSSGKH